MTSPRQAAVGPGSSPAPATSRPLPPTPISPADPEPPVTRLTVFSRAATATAGAAVVGLAGLTIFTVRTILAQTLISLFLAISLDPPVRWMVRHGARRGLAVTVIFLTTLALIVPLAWAFIPPLMGEIAAFVTDFPGYLARLRETSTAFAEIDDRLHLQEHVDGWITTLPSHANDALVFGQRFIGAVSSAGLVAVLTIYVMLDLPKLRRGLVALCPQRHRRAVDDSIGIVTEKVGSYMIGNLAISAIAAVSSFIVLELLDVPYAFALAVIVAVTDLLPMIGATLGASICVLVALATTDPWPNATLVLVFFVLYQQAENYLIAPRVLRGTVQMPALAVLLATLVGGALLGLVGVLMAIPIAAAIKTITATLARQQRRS